MDDVDMLNEDFKVWKAVRDRLRKGVEIDQEAECDDECDY